MFLAKFLLVVYVSGSSFGGYVVVLNLNLNV